MKETIALVVLYLIFFPLSLLYRKKVIYMEQKWVFTSILIYLIFIWGYFWLILKTHQYLRNNAIVKFDFGHTEISLVLFTVVCYVTAVVIIINILYRRSRI